MKAFITWLIPIMAISLMVSCGDHPAGKNISVSAFHPDSSVIKPAEDDYSSTAVMLLLPSNPDPGEPFRIFSTAVKNIRKAHIKVSGPSGNIESHPGDTGDEFPFWRIDDFRGAPAGKYKASLVVGTQVAGEFEFTIIHQETTPHSGAVWKTLSGWNSKTELLYSAWINSLFRNCDENSSWSALHEVTQDKDRNFLFNYLSLGEDDRDRKNSLTMMPDCADNPFFLRAYFAWKLGLPFGYHVCDRGYLGHNPQPGIWITNESVTSKSDPVRAFDAFLRSIKDGVHSGTARTSLSDVKSDYYPVSLERASLHPGIVYADPYGHTLTLVGLIPQTARHPGLLLAVDAQPDGTIAIKRFWKGNFLFNTSGVVGEPGFKAFRPIKLQDGVLVPMRNDSLTMAAGFTPFSLEQRKMGSDLFYHTMERIINPEPLDPETALSDLLQALYEQLLVRVTSVASGEAYFKSHPGTVIPMPSGAAGIFLTGGQWENFSTPNRDLRLLIAMDAVLGYPDIVASSPGDYDLSKFDSPAEAGKKLHALLDEKSAGLKVSYTRSDGSVQTLTVGEILQRRESFEMAYNPNDGVEIRWGAPENSKEISTCQRRAPSTQQAIMRSVRPWFQKRLHPPT